MGISNAKMAIRIIRRRLEWGMYRYELYMLTSIYQTLNDQQSLDQIVVSLISENRDYSILCYIINGAHAWRFITLQ